jgi:hypothetical protein
MKLSEHIAPGFTANLLACALTLALIPLLLGPEHPKQSLPYSLAFCAEQ